MARTPFPRLRLYARARANVGSRISDFLSHFARHRGTAPVARPSPEPPVSDPLLARFAARASFDPGFLGHALGVYQVLHGLTDAALADLLGCPVATLANVRLCGAVRADHFAEDVAAVADTFGLRPDVLARIVRG